MRYFYSLLAVVVLAVALTAPIQAAFTKISDLPAITSPSTNTWIEVADMAAATKSRKYLLTNLATVAQVPTLPTNMVVSSGPSLAGQAAVYTDTTGTNTAPSLLTITNGAINAGNVYADARVYGVLMDGSDDTAALQAAVNSGRIVIIPAGTLTFSGTIYLTNSSGIIGQGMSVTTLRKTGTGPAIRVEGASTVSRLTYTTLKGFKLQGDAAANAGDYGISYYHCNVHHALEDVEIRAMGDYGLYIQGDSYEVRARNIFLVDNLGADQLLIDAIFPLASNDNTVDTVYVLPYQRSVHISGQSTMNTIRNLTVEIPAGSHEIMYFDGNLVKWNFIDGVNIHDPLPTNGITANVVFNNAAENVINKWTGGFTEVPMFDFRTNSIRNTIVNSSGSNSGIVYKTSSGSTGNTLLNWTGGDPTLAAPGNVETVAFTQLGVLDFPTIRMNGVTVVTNDTAANWVASGTTNSGLPGVARSAEGYFTNYVYSANIRTPGQEFLATATYVALDPSLTFGWRVTPAGAFDTILKRTAAKTVALTSDGSTNYGTLRASIEGTTGVFTNTVTAQSLSVSNMVFQKTRVIRQALTHAGGTITLNLATNVPGNATCTLTGAVTFASSNLIDGSQYDLIFFSSGASNSITWGPEFRFAGYKPGSIAATNSAGLATMGHLWAEANGTNLLCTYAEEQ